jgi:hypothetical protein
MRSACVRWLGLLALALGARAAGAGTFVYVHDYGLEAAAGANQVFGFSLARDGMLEPLPGSPFVGPDDPATGGNFCGGYCQTMAYARRAKLLVTSGPGGATPWRVAEDGALEAVPGAPFRVETGRFFGVAAVEQKRTSFVYLVDWFNDSLYGFRVEDDGSLGSLPSVAPVELGDVPIVVAARKRFLAVVNSADGTLSSFRIEDDGSLVEAPGSPLPIGATDAYTLDLDRAGRHLYTGSILSSDAYLFAVDPRTGALEAGAANPVGTDLGNAGLGFALLRGARGFALSIEGELQGFRRAKRGELRLLGEPAPLGFVALAHGLAGGRTLLAAANNLELRALRVKASGEVLELDAAPLAASNVNAVLVVQR